MHKISLSWWLATILLRHVRSINIDNVLGGYMATLHLLQQGHVNIAHIKGLSSRPDAGNRFEGYKKALQEAGIKSNAKTC